ncbi:amidohydrolase [Vibrio cortegadensis]|uniref:Amidohydrolase n=1 Tax=Vibrio cortegadensis TaxID=1328770 RepID=A0ABV4M6F7_9VIBR
MADVYNMDNLVSTLSDFNATEFRRQLHQYPELSLNEVNTAALIAAQLREFGLFPVTQIGGNGVICTIESGVAGDTTLLRADFDALPISEKSSIAHCSRHEGVMHACGHDGHTASLMLVAKHLAITPPQFGKVVLLFQPAEEIGTGAASMLNDNRVATLNVDHVFAYHNLPGYPLNTIIVKPNAFACASTGVIIELEGKTSHAARPENGINPTSAMVQLIQYLQNLPQKNSEAFTLVTVVHAYLGEEAFGTAPGKATVMATLRSDDGPLFEKMKSDLRETVSEIAVRDNLTCHVEWQESFNAVMNSPKHCDIVCQQAEKIGLPLVELDEPMRWSEDVSEFLAKWPGALFCIGSGAEHPQLHNPDYDFPDQLIETASAMFTGIIQQLHRR